MVRFAGKTALVTGATQGLGADIARVLHAEGATVILSGIDDSRAEPLLRELPKSEYWNLNVADEAHWTNAAALLRRRNRTLDVLVNNAGIVRYEPIVSCAAESFRDVMNVNLMGVFFGIKHMCELMPSGSSIVNISSCAGLEGINGACSYVASKWAVTGLTQAAALELGHRGIRVNSVHPRAMETDLIADQVAGGGEESLFGSQAIPRIGKAVEIARMVAFLASSESSYCTGGAYVVDGGYMAGQVMKNMAMS
jgi:3alpha(or 20beta)-hydroxysteroid dehydrogenase